MSLRALRFLGAAGGTACRALPSRSMPAIGTLGVGVSQVRRLSQYCAGHVGSDTAMARSQTLPSLPAIGNLPEP
jgi:hypothetical protein